MTYETINAAKAIELLEQVVKGKENYVYPSELGCVYVEFDKGACSCLVGHALVAHGVPLDFFAQQINDETKTDINGWGVASLVNEGYLPFVTRRAMEVFAIAQDVQDADQPWGEALERAKRVLGNTAYSDELS